jgi:hypothetical protein
MSKVKWEEFTQYAVPVPRRNGVLCLSQTILDSMKENPVGFYIYTKESAYKKNQYKCGQTTAGGDYRVVSQTAESNETICIVGWIPSNKPLEDSKYDQKIHNRLHDEGKSIWNHRVDPKKSPGKEWSTFNSDDDPVLIWMRALNGEQIRKELQLTRWQYYAVDELMVALCNGKKRILAELAARFGKTNTFLALHDVMNQQVMVVSSYVQTVFSSFEKEIYKYSQFEDMIVLDMKSKNFKVEFEQALTTEKKIVVMSSLCGSSTVEENSEVVSKFEDKIVITDEADFGVHTENVSPRLLNIVGNSPLILTTGTNSDVATERIDTDHYIRYTYFDLLMIRDSEHVSH